MFEGRGSASSSDVRVSSNGNQVAGCGWLVVPGTGVMFLLLDGSGFLWVLRFWGWLCVEAVRVTVRLS